MTTAEMQRIVFNDYLDAVLAALFVLVVIAMLYYDLVSIWRALAVPHITAREVGIATASK
jgi:carbon starvation protein